MYSHRGPREPIFNNAPTVVLALLGAIILLSAIQFLGGETLRGWIQSRTAVYEGPPISGLGGPQAYVLHVFSHGNWSHLLLNMLAGFAFGVPVARRLGETRNGAIAFVILFFASAVVGALTQVVFDDIMGKAQSGLIGASTGVSGVLAAAMYVLRAGLVAPLPSISSDTYVTAMAPWVLLNLAPIVIGAVAPGAFGDLIGGIAWMSHLGGMLAGALLFPLLDRWSGAASQRRAGGWPY